MIAIIDYKAGNLTSVARAVSYLGYECKVTSDLKEILSAERIIFPGVGAAGSAMSSLKSEKIDIALKNYFKSGKPILGICLGTQVIMDYSQENDTKCIGLIEGSVKSFPKNMSDQNDKPLKIPQMGWNRVVVKTSHPVLSSILEDNEFYFVHGYYPQPTDAKHILGVTEYGIVFPSIIGHKNLIATQFHLEKSGKPGLNLLKNFCNWNP